MQIENVSAGGSAIGARYERGRRVGHILKIGRPSESNVEAPPENRCLHGLGGITGDSGVPARTVNREGPQGDTRHSVVEVVDASVAFVGALEDAIVSRGL